MDYKDKTKTLDIVVLLVKNIIPIIHDKINNSISNINQLIRSGNISALQKKQPVLSEIIKNYMIITSSYALLVGYNHTANYYRKLLKCKQTKLEKFENAFNNFIEQLKSIQSAIEYFAKSIEPSGKPKIENLADISKLISKLLSKLEKNMTTHKTKKSSNLNNLNNSVKQDMISGGVDSCKLQKVKLGGKIYMGGYIVNEYIKKIIIQLHILESNIKNIDKDSYKESLQSLGMSLNTFYKIAQMSSLEYANFLINYLNLDKNIKKVIFNSTLQNLLTYYFKHTAKYMPNKQINITWETLMTPDNNKITINVPELKLNESITNVDTFLNTVEKVMNAIDTLDIKIIKNAVISEFKLINNIKTIDQMPVIDTNELSKELNTNTRPIVKSEIRSLITQAKNILQKIHEIKFPIIKNDITIGNFKNDKDEIAQGIKILKVIKNILMNKQFNTALQDIEKLYNSQAVILSKLSDKIMELISSNTDTCIIHAIKIANNILLRDILPKLALERFNIELENIEYDKKISILKYKLYTDSLNLNNLNALSKELCCIKS